MCDMPGTVERDVEHWPLRLTLCQRHHVLSRLWDGIGRFLKLDIAKLKVALGDQPAGSMC